jgi:hypothetical protein
MQRAKIKIQLYGRNSKRNASGSGKFASFKRRQDIAMPTQTKGAAQSNIVK